MMYKRRKINISMKLKVRSCYVTMRKMNHSQTIMMTTLEKVVVKMITEIWRMKMLLATFNMALYHLGTNISLENRLFFKTGYMKMVRWSQFKKTQTFSHKFSTILSNFVNKVLKIYNSIILHTNLFFILNPNVNLHCNSILRLIKNQIISLKKRL